jgi:rod shape-determining protein MreC
VSRRYFKKRRLLLAGLLAALLIYLFSAFPILQILRDVTVTALVSPLMLVRNVAVYFQGKRTLETENKLLRSSNAELSLEIAKLKDLQDENARLRELLSFGKKFDFRTIAAEVISRDPNDWSGSFMIDRGASDGLKNQSAVCSSKGLLGKVVEAGETRSFVVLVTHPNFKTGGLIQGTGINGVVVGARGGMMKMLYIPNDALVEKGAVVVTSELSSIFPEGILIGRVVTVERSETGLYKYAMIEPFADPFTEEVLCIIEK